MSDIWNAITASERASAEAAEAADDMREKAAADRWERLCDASEALLDAHQQATTTLAGLGITLTPGEDPVAVLCQAMRLETGDAGALPEGWVQVAPRSYRRSDSARFADVCQVHGVDGHGQHLTRWEAVGDGPGAAKTALAAIRAAKETP